MHDFMACQQSVFMQETKYSQKCGVVVVGDLPESIIYCTRWRSEVQWSSYQFSVPKYIHLCVIKVKAKLPLCIIN
jgi:hypothetical protein